VERATRPHRELLAEELERAGVERKREAMRVLAELERLTSNDVQYGGTPPWLVSTIWRWDAERERGRPRSHRLVYSPLSDFGASGELERWIFHTVRIFKDEIRREAERRIDSKWHVRRADGHRARFRRVEACSTELRGIIACRRCGACPENHRVMNACDSHLLCMTCRKRRQRRYRAKFAEARLGALRRVSDARVGVGQVCRDPIVERFLTLTCPHIPLELGGPELQARVVAKAASYFAKSVRDVYRRRVKGGRLAERALEVASFVRCLEATTGRDELGHVHVHAWILGPFLRAQVLRFLWGRALLRAGFPWVCWPEHAIAEKQRVLTELATANRGQADHEASAYLQHVAPSHFPYPRIDLQRVTPRGYLDNGEQLARELIKYLTKDLDGKATDAVPVLMAPHLFASVFRGLLGRRMLSSSLGFWLRRIVCCDACAAIGTVTLHFVSDENAPREERGPPPLFALRQGGNRTGQGTELTT